MSGDGSAAARGEGAADALPDHRRCLFTRTLVGEVKAVDGVDFTVRRGETLGLVGESGCGKTTTGRCILRLDRPTGRRDPVRRRRLSRRWSARNCVALRRRIQVIFQDPYSSLNPRMTVGEIIGEPMQGARHRAGRGEAHARECASCCRSCGLRPALRSTAIRTRCRGGQRQRVGIARALALNPEFIVCDEPVSALDVSIQAQIVNLLEDLHEQFGLTYLFIAHDLSVVRHICDRVAVMYLGRIVEMADSDELYGNPLHPYTQALLSAVPMPDPAVETQRTFRPVQGEVPSPINPPSGCVFHPRCPIAVDDCKRERPELREAATGAFRGVQRSAITETTNGGTTTPREATPCDQP